MKLSKNKNSCVVNAGFFASETQSVPQTLLQRMQEVIQKEIVAMILFAANTNAHVWRCGDLRLPRDTS